MPNPTGHPATLQPSQPGNANARRHGIFSERLREPRAQEVADALMDLPHVVPADELAAREVGRLEAYVDALDAELARVGVCGPVARVSMLLDMRLRASRRLMEALDRFGGTPLARAKWARELAEGENLATAIARKRAEAERRGGGGS